MLRKSLILLACLALAACGGRQIPQDTPAARSGAVAPAAVAAPNFGDAKPITDWGGRAPQSYPVHGIDIARYQTEVDWPTARANGVNFAFIKATEGGDMVDPMFATHWREAGRAGVRACERASVWAREAVLLE